MWKPIPNYEGYEASDLGEVRSWNPRNGRGAKGSAKEPTLLKPTKFTDSDYLRVGIKNSVTNKQDTRRVHQVVLEAFVGPCPTDHVVMHLDDDPSNNALTNLRYGTPQDNLDDMVAKGRSVRGEDHPRSITTDAVRTEVIRLALAKPYKGSRTEISDMLNLPINTVRRVIENYNLRARKEGLEVATIKNSRA